MRAWLLYFEKDIEKNKYNINKYISEGRNKGISIECKSVEEVDLNKDSLPFFVIARMIHPRLSEELENQIGRAHV